VIRVLAVDDHALLREGIAALIANRPDMELLAKACDESVCFGIDRMSPYMDLRMPGAASEAIGAEFPDLSVAPGKGAIFWDHLSLVLR
jgi:DNA-binding NarL/FixJ family response regulator